MGGAMTMVTSLFEQAGVKHIPGRRRAGVQCQGGAVAPPGHKCRQHVHGVPLCVPGQPHREHHTRRCAATVVWLLEAAPRFESFLAVSVFNSS
jgi:hypothetical protein